MDAPAPPRLLDAFRATRLTPGGQWFVQVSLAVGVVAFAGGYGPAYAAFSLLAALCLVGYGGAVHAGRRLDLEWTGPSRVFAHEEFVVRLVIRNRSRLPLGPVEVRPAGVRPLDRAPAALVPMVAGRGSAVAEVVTSLRRRGAHRVRGPGLVVGWPFGFAEFQAAPGSETEILAYPRRVPVPPRLLAGASPAADARRSRPTPPRGGDLLRGLRDFVPGDAPRGVAWRATARHGRLLSREFEREDRAGAVVLLDADARDLPPGDRRTATERACSVAASLLLRLRADGRRVAFGAWTPRPVWIPAAGSRAGIAEALEALARLVPPGPRAPRRDPLDLVPAAHRRGADVLVVSARGGGERRMPGRRGATVVSVGAMRATFAGEDA